MKQPYLALIILLFISPFIYHSCNPEEVYPELSVDFVYDLNEPFTVGDTVEFGQKTVGLPTHFSWRFAGGIPDTSDLEKVAVVFQDEGTYEIRLIAWNAKGDRDTAIKVVTVGEGLVADFIAEPQISPPDSVISFAHTSTGSPAPKRFLWSFPGGEPSISEAENPTVVYRDTGFYDVSLIIGNDFAFDTVRKNQYIHITNEQEPLSISCSAIPLKGTAPHTVNFRGEDDLGESSSVSYIWTFGDGDTAQGKSAEHTYEEPGSYVARLEAFNEGGDSAACTFNIIVTQGTPSAKPKVDCLALPKQGIAPLRVTFAGSASDPDPDGEIVSMEWDFGDGEVSGPNPVPFPIIYQFSSRGFYLVRLIVRDANGNEDICTIDITI